MIYILAAIAILAVLGVIAYWAAKHHASITDRVDAAQTAVEQAKEKADAVVQHVTDVTSEIKGKL